MKGSKLEEEEEEEDGGVSSGLKGGVYQEMMEGGCNSSGLGTLCHSREMYLFHPEA